MRLQISDCRLHLNNELLNRKVSLAAKKMNNCISARIDLKPLSARRGVGGEANNSNDYFYVPSYNTTMELSLRRTLQGFVRY